MTKIELSSTDNLPNSSAPRENKSFFSKFFVPSLSSLDGHGAEIIGMIEEEVNTEKGSIEALSRYLPTIAIFEYWMLECMIEQQRQYEKRQSRRAGKKDAGTEPIELKQQNPSINWQKVTEGKMIDKLKKFVRKCKIEGMPAATLEAMKITEDCVKQYVKMQSIGGQEVAGTQTCNWPLGCPTNADISIKKILGNQEDHVNLSARKGRMLQPMCGLHNRWKSSNPLFNLLSYHHNIFL